VELKGNLYSQHISDAVLGEFIVDVIILYVTLSAISLNISRTLESSFGI
jgi:hypothetical protein